MLPVRELAELARRLSLSAFARQMGPFALMQRPPPESRVEEARQAADKATAPLPALRLRGAPSAVDFGDLIVATLPPPARDGTLELLIGRGANCDLVVEDAAVSNRHAAIAWNGSDGIIRELGSANGTFINGHRMKSQWTLRSGDQVGIGSSTFIYLLAAQLHERLRRTSAVE